MIRTAREWLEEADFDGMNAALFDSFVQTVGYDKACEVSAALKRISENLLDTLGELRLSEETMLKLLAAVSAIAVDTYLPVERQRD